jgi:hypothetical protein
VTQRPPDPSPDGGKFLHVHSEFSLLDVRQLGDSQLILARYSANDTAAIVAAGEDPRWRAVRRRY